MPRERIRLRRIVSLMLHKVNHVRLQQETQGQHMNKLMIKAML